MFMPYLLVNANTAAWMKLEQVLINFITSIFVTTLLSAAKDTQTAPGDSCLSRLL